MSEWNKHPRRGWIETRPYTEGEVLHPRISISEADRNAGSPKLGDMIARNPNNHDDQWLIAKDFFAQHYGEEMESQLFVRTMSHLEYLVDLYQKVCGAGYEDTSDTQEQIIDALEERILDTLTALPKGQV